MILWIFEIHVWIRFQLITTKHTQPWINSNIKHLTCRKQRAYNHVCATNTDYDWAKYKILKDNISMDVVNVLTSMYLISLTLVVILSPNDYGHMSRARD